MRLSIFPPLDLGGGMMGDDIELNDDDQEGTCVFGYLSRNTLTSTSRGNQPNGYDSDTLNVGVGHDAPLQDV